MLNLSSQNALRAHPSMMHVGAAPASSLLPRWLHFLCKQVRPQAELYFPRLGSNQLSLSHPSHWHFGTCLPLVLRGTLVPARPFPPALATCRCLPDDFRPPSSLADPFSGSSCLPIVARRISRWPASELSRFSPIFFGASTPIIGWQRGHLPMLALRAVWHFSHVSFFVLAVLARSAAALAVCGAALRS